MPHHPPIVALGYSQASMLLRRPRHGVAAIISVCGAREHRVEAAVSHQLDLCFDDAEVLDPANVESLVRAQARSRAARQTGLLLTPPSINDARRIIDFARARCATSTAPSCASAALASAARRRRR